MYVSKDAPTYVRLLALSNIEGPSLTPTAAGLSSRHSLVSLERLTYFGSSLMKTLRNHSVLPWCCNSIWPVGYIGLFRSQ
jgi:hypothetical protein